MKLLRIRMALVVFICLIAALFTGLTRRSLAQGIGAKRGQVQSTSAAKPRSGRFLGWKDASRQGREYLSQFARRRANVAGSEASAAGEPGQPLAGLPARLVAGRARPGTRLVTPDFSTNPQFLPGFGFRTSLPADFLPTAVATGDFNRDGKMDWAVANGGSNNVWIYSGNGDGTAALPTVISLAGKSPTAIAAASLRGNGILDLIVAEADSSSIEVLLGNGDGTFGHGTLYTLADSPTSLAVADFNGDGHLDVAVGLMSNPGNIQPWLAMYPGDGAGNLGTAITFVGSAEVSPDITSIVAGDLNGDGKPDLVALDGSTVYVFLNQGNGSFSEFQTINGTGDIEAIALGDMNEDHCLDLITASSQGVGYIGKGNCSGTFQDFSNWTVFATGDTGFGLQVADVNGDGHLDVVASGARVVNYTQNGINAGDLLTVMTGDGTGNVAAPKIYRGQPGMYSLALADLNNDGHLDAVTANQDSDSATVYLNDGSGGFGDPSGGYFGYVTNNTLGTLQAAASNFVPVDINGDNKPDLVLMEYPQVNGDPWEIAVLLNDGTGHFGAPIRSSTGLSSAAPLGDFVFGDFRNTGKQDFLAVGSMFGPETPSICFARNNGDGTFGTPTITAPPFALGIIATGDFNGDGNLDFVVASSSGNSNGSTELIEFYGHGDGTFTPGPITTFDSNDSGPALIFSGDFNHDGKTDLLVWDHGNTVGPTESSRLFELLGNGDGSFGAPTLVVPNLGYFALGDLNHDGLPDIVELVQSSDISTPQFGPPIFNIYLGQKDGSFQLTNTYSPYVGQYGASFEFGKGTSEGGSPLVADFNGDGNLDIAAYQIPKGTNQAVLQILLGNGDGTFTPSYTSFDFGNPSVPGLAVDVDGDGRADLVELDGYASSYHVIKASAGPSAQLRLNTDPVIGAAGGVTITLPFASSTSTTVTLAASDPAITITSSVSIPAGSVVQSVPFSIGSSFNPAHVFSIAATTGGQTATVYGTQGTTQVLNIQMFINNPTQNILPSETTGDYGVNLVSVGGYASDPALSCIHLPAGASCQFGQSPLPLEAGLQAYSSLTVQVPSNVAPGSYQFSVIANDGTISVGASPQLYVGDFKLSLNPASGSTTPKGGDISFAVSITPLFNFPRQVTLTCSRLPAGARCTSIPSETLGIRTLTVVMPSTTIGVYPITITGTSGPISHSLATNITVGDFSGSVSNTALTLATISTIAQTTVTLTSLDQLSGAIQLACGGTTVPVTCNFGSSPLFLPAGGTAHTVLNISEETVGEVPWIHRVRSFATGLGMWSFGIALAPAILIFVPARRRRNVALAFSLVFLICLASCGGGGGGGSSSGGTGGNSGGGGSSSTITFAVPVNATFGNETKTIALIQVTAPN